MPKDKDTAAGAVDDARPDRWGERVLRFLDKPSRLSLLEYLYFAGDDRFAMCPSFGLKTDEASREVRVVLRAIGRWKQHFKSCGVSAHDIESLAEQIDRPFLADQRREL